MEHGCSKQITMCKKTRNKDDDTVCYIELGNNPAYNNKNLLKITSITLFRKII